MTLAQAVSAEKEIHTHDRVLASLAQTLEDWLTGRVGLEATKVKVAQAKSQLSPPLSLPSQVAGKVQAAELGLLVSVERFCADSSPDAQGQKLLFSRLNDLTRERSMALLAWRVANNRALIAQHSSGPVVSYLRWESAWLPLWTSEVEVTHRLQKAFLATSQGKPEDASRFVRELLALRTQADKVSTPPSLADLQQLSVARLTVLARTCEQLERLGRAQSRGALTRLRRLNKEQAEMAQTLQESRLAYLSALAQK